jgi:hypothetical protein
MTRTLILAIGATLLATAAQADSAKADARAAAVIRALERCRAISGTDVPASYMRFREFAWRSRIYSACRSAAGL